MKNLFQATLILLGSASILSAATSFTADFNNNLANPNIDTSVGGTPTYTGGNATFSGASRYYLHTDDFNYATTNFTVEATLTLTSVDPNSVGFFGMGAGDNTGAFGTPGGPAIYAEIAPQSFANGFVRFNDTAANDANLSGPTNFQGDGSWGAGTVHRVRLQWDATTQIATFLFDKNYNGTFVADFTQVYNGTTAGLDSTNNGFNSGNSSLFFGAGQGSSWDNFSVTVVPEPSAALLGGLGLLGLMRRRR